MFDKDKLAQLMEQAKSMQDKLQQAHEKMSKTEFVGEAGAGMVKVAVTGDYQVKKINIDKTQANAIDDLDMISDLIVAAINDAQRKIKAQNGKMTNVLGDLLPKGFPDFKMPE